RLARFLKAYQEHTPLTIGELWAIAITLRLTLVENLTRLIAATVARVSAAQRANDAANAITAALAKDPSAHKALDILRDEVIGPAFLARFEQRLRDHGASAQLILDETERLLEAQGTTSELVRSEEHTS